MWGPGGYPIGLGMGYLLPTCNARWWIAYENSYSHKQTVSCVATYRIRMQIGEHTLRVGGFCEISQEACYRVIHSTHSYSLL